MTEVHWGEARAFLSRAIRHELFSREGAILEDLVQEACVRLLRALRREPAINLEGLMTEIARRTVVDYKRRTIRARATFQPMGDETPDAPDPNARESGELGDPLERLRFLVDQFFKVRSPECCALARAYFEREDWKAVAVRLGQGYDAVRQKWSRCLTRLRAAAREDGGPLLEWA